MTRPLAVLICCLCLSTPALAHSLRVFATVEGTEVTGYGFFVGGGRPKGIEWVATLSGRDVARGVTDAEGGFAFAAPSTIDGPLTVTLDSGEGHVASRILGPERFGEVLSVPAQPLPVQSTTSPTATEITEAIVQTAVAREITPLLERIEEMDARMRLTDIVSGLCLIFGIAGIALWARGRRS